MAEPGHPVCREYGQSLSQADVAPGLQELVTSVMAKSGWTEVLLQIRELYLWSDAVQPSTRQ